MAEDIPNNPTILSTLWRLTTKRDANGKMLKRKARLVMRGDQQKEGKDDFEETYAATVTKRCNSTMLGNGCD